jgi:hypothetical protein
MHSYWYQLRPPPATKLIGPPASEDHRSRGLDSCNFVRRPKPLVSPGRADADPTTPLYVPLTQTKHQRRGRRRINASWTTNDTELERRGDTPAFSHEGQPERVGCLLDSG